MLVLNPPYSNPDKTCEEIINSCRTNSSNYEAEAKAIDASLHNIAKHFKDKTKAKSELQLVIGGNHEAAFGETNVSSLGALRC